MAGAGKKTFTAGEVLTASDVNTYLMEQSVMYFAGTAARSSAIPTPSTGMTSYIGVTGTASIPQLETYTGSAWQTPYGTTLVASATIGSGVTSFLMDNVFSSAYRNYTILINGAQTGTIDGYIMRLRDSTGTLGGTLYHYSGIETQSTSGTISWRAGAATSEVRIGTGGGSNASASYNFAVNVYSPFLTQGTNFFASASTNARGSIGNVIDVIAGSHEGATSCHGFGLFMFGSATITGGTVQVYGHRNS